MKTKTIIFLGSVALVTLSFSFVAANKEEAKAPAAAPTAQQTLSSEPIGGFGIETLVK